MGKQDKTRRDRAYPAGAGRPGSRKRDGESGRGDRRVRRKSQSDGSSSDSEPAVSQTSGSSSSSSPSIELRVSADGSSDAQVLAGYNQAQETTGEVNSPAAEVAPPISTSPPGKDRLSSFSQSGARGGGGGLINVAKGFGTTSASSLGKHGSARDGKSAFPSADLFSPWKVASHAGSSGKVASHATDRFSPSPQGSTQPSTPCLSTSSGKHPGSAGKVASHATDRFSPSPQCSMQPGEKKASSAPSSWTSSGKRPGSAGQVASLAARHLSPSPDSTQTGKNKAKPIRISAHGASSLSDLLKAAVREAQDRQTKGSSRSKTQHRTNSGSMSRNESLSGSQSKSQYRTNSGSMSGNDSLSGSQSGSLSEKESPAPDQPASDHVKKATDESVTAELFQFLNGFVQPGELRPYYVSQLLAMKERGNCFSLEIHFEDILRRNYDLALDLLKRPHVCVEATKRLMRINNFAPEPVIRQKGTAQLFRCPTTIVALEEIVKDKTKLVKLVKDILSLDNTTVAVLSDLAIALLSGFLTDVKKNHEKNLSWAGQFTIKDMVVINGCEFRITKKPSEYGMGSKGDFSLARVKDLQMLEKIFTAFLQSGESIDSADIKTEGLPLLYGDLRKFLMGVTKDMVREKWFWDFLLHHPALKTPLVRKQLVELLHELFLNPKYFSAQIQDVLKKCPRANDWREDVPESESHVLHSVYHYEHEDQKNKKNKGGSQENLNDGHQAENQEKTDKGNQRKALKPKFDNTFGGIVKYNRHFLQHASEYVKVVDRTEIEIYFSHVFDYLPLLLLMLLSERFFTEASGSQAWAVYSSFQIRTIDDSQENCSLNSQEKCALNLCFW